MERFEEDFKVDVDRAQQVMNAAHFLLGLETGGDVSAKQMMDYFCVCIGKLMPDLLEKFEVDESDALAWIGKVIGETGKFETGRDIREPWFIKSHIFEVKAVPRKQ